MEHSAINQHISIQHPIMKSLWISVMLMLHNTTTVLWPSVWDYPGEPVPEETPTHHPDHHPIFISFFHLPRSIASSLFKLHAWQPFCTTSFYVLFGLSLGLEPSTSYSIHFFTQSVSSFRTTCPYHRSLFCCSINIISSIPSLSLNSLLGTLSFTHPSDHSHFCILLCTQLQYGLPLLINDISLMVSNGTNCLNLFHPIQILASTTASASPSTLNSIT